jgi:hypothetical protein
MSESKSKRESQSKSESKSKSEIASGSITSRVTARAGASMKD